MSNPSAVAIQPRRNCPILDPTFYKHGDLCSKSKLEDSDLDTLGISHGNRRTDDRDFLEMDDLWLD